MLDGFVVSVRMWSWVRCGPGGRSCRQRSGSAAQSRADREQAAIEDAIHRTFYGGDINFMSKDDW